MGLFDRSFWEKKNLNRRSCKEALKILICLKIMIALQKLREFQEEAGIAEEASRRRGKSRHTVIKKPDSEPDVEAHQEEVEELPNSEKVEEEENTEHEEAVEENSSEVLKQKLAVEETVQKI